MTNPLVTMERVTELLKKHGDFAPHPPRKPVALWEMQNAMAEMLKEAQDEALRRGMQ